MKQLYYVVAAALIFTGAAAHEMTPTYPEMKPSYIDEVSTTQMRMWNRRNDVFYYEITVFDDQWNPVPFATPNKIIRLGFLETKTFDVYIRDKDVDRVEYICSTSKQLKEDVQSTGIKSRICSRVK